MKWFGILALVFFLFLLAGIVYVGANTDKIGFVIIPGAFATHDPNFNHPTPQTDQVAELENTNIAMTLNQVGYQTGETIKVSGTVANTESFVFITVFKADETFDTSYQMMLNENSTGIVPTPMTPIDENAIVTITQMLPHENGTFSYQFKAGNGNMDVSGIYAIQMEHESQSITSEFYFQVVEEEPYFGIFVYIDNLFSWITGN